jgi:hypothetical protein
MALCPSSSSTYSFAQALASRKRAIYARDDSEHEKGPAAGHGGAFSYLSSRGRTRTDDPLINSQML